MKLYFGDLPCYQNLTLDVMLRPSYEPDASFDLSRMPNESLRQAFAAFIFDRASSLSYSSLRSEATHFHNFARFISDAYPNLQSITDIPFNDMEKELKKYLIKQGKPLVTNKKKRDRKLQGSQRHPDLLYLRTVYDYFLPDEPKEFDKDRDIWRLESMPFMLRASPIGCDTRVNFTKIRQDEIKHEVKEGALYHLKRLAVRTVIQEVGAINNLSEFLDKNYPDIQTLKDFNRALLEEYLSYLYLECDRRKDYRGELSNLKSLLNIIGKLLGYDNLRGIFLKSDFQKHKRTIYKSYSDEDIKALHLGYKLLDKQTARLLLIHELLGLRISDTMTIKTEDVFLGDDPYVRISQSKTGNGYNKKLNAELAALFRACIEETTEKYGFCEYIFVSDKDPTKPMKYTTLRYRLSSMINTLDLRDSNGNPLTPSTHLFRHTYGKKLCDLLNDDATIAALLGHKSISSVAYYRQMSPKVLADNTKPVIDARNEKIKKFKKGWME